MTAAHYAAQSDCAGAIELLMTLHVEDLIKRAGYIDSMVQAGQLVKGDETDMQPDNIAIDRPSKSGATPLHVAACFDAKDAVDALLKYGVQVIHKVVNIVDVHLLLFVI
jgi:ankyrin repeat protein